MPIQIIVPEGVLTAEAEAEAFRKLTELLLRLHGLTGNKFMTPNVIGEVTVVPKGRTFSGGKRTVTDGPFAEAKELVAGFWLIQVKSKEEAIEWVKRCPNPMPGEDSEIEIRQVFEMDDFNDVLNT